MLGLQVQQFVKVTDFLGLVPLQTKGERRGQLPGVIPKITGSQGLTKTKRTNAKAEKRNAVSKRLSWINSPTVHHDNRSSWARSKTSAGTNTELPNGFILPGNHLAWARPS